MWETACYDWEQLALAAGSDAMRIPKALELAMTAEGESVDRHPSEWGAALMRLDGYGSDDGPNAMTPVITSCLVSMALQVGGIKRSSIVKSLEELTCGRGAGGYSEQQQRWLIESVFELTLGLKLWVWMLEYSNREDATECYCLLAYCAKYQPALRDRMRKYLELSKQRFPELGPHIGELLTYVELRSHRNGSRLNRRMVSAGRTGRACNGHAE